MYSLVIKLSLIATVAVFVPGCLKKLDPNESMGGGKKSGPPPATPAPAASTPATMFGFSTPGTQGKLVETVSTSFKIKQGALGGDSSKKVATSASFKLRGNFYGL